MLVSAVAIAFTVMFIVGCWGFILVVKALGFLIRRKRDLYYQSLNEQRKLESKVK